MTFAYTEASKVSEDAVVGDAMGIGSKGGQADSAINRQGCRQAARHRICTQIFCIQLFH